MIGIPNERDITTAGIYGAKLESPFNLSFSLLRKLIGSANGALTISGILTLRKVKA